MQTNDRRRENNSVYYLLYIVIMHRSIFTIVLSLLVFVLDLRSKYIFYDKQLYADRWLITAHFNEGIAWSIPIPMLVVMLVTLGAIAALSWLYYQKQITRWIYAIILAGALWNLYDRVVLWWVRDFIDLGFWPIFNIADIAITIWAIAIIIRTLFPWKFGWKQ